MVPNRDLLGKRVQRCRSLPSVALRSFLNDTQVSENKTFELLLRVCASTCGWKRSEGGRRGELSYVKKTILGKYVTCKLYWLIFTSYNVKDFKNVDVWIIKWMVQSQSTLTGRTVSFWAHTSLHQPQGNALFSRIPVNQSFFDRHKGHRGSRPSIAISLTPRPHLTTVLNQ